MRSRTEEGAVAIATALITCIVLLPLGALAVDIGQQRVARRDVQAIADVVSMDMARDLAHGTTPSVALATDSAARSSPSLGHTPTMGVFLGYIDPSAAFVSSQSRGCGSAVYDSYFAAVPAGAQANAVLVTAQTPVAFLIQPGSGAACRSAVGSVASSACFGLGSYAAAVNSGNSAVLGPLNDIFGLSLRLVDYQGLASAKVTLASLAANSRFGSPNALLTGSVRVSDLVSAAIDVLTQQNSAGNAAAITTLNSILGAVGSLPSITLTHLLQVSPTDTAALGVQFSALNIVTGAVLLADGNHAVTIPNVWANVAGTGSTASSSLAAIQGATTGCGLPNSSSASADSTQLTGQLAFTKMNSPSINLSVGNLKTGIGTGSLQVNAASAHGTLVAPPPVHCGAGTAQDPATFGVSVAGKLASVQLTTQLPVTGTVTVAGLGLVNLNLVVDSSASSVQAPATALASLSLPPNDATPVSTGRALSLDPNSVTSALDASSSASSLGLPVDVNSPLLASTIASVLAGVNSTFVQKSVVPLISNIDADLLVPLQQLLGVEVGGADVYALSAACGAPRLAG